eukprot:45122_1
MTASVGLVAAAAVAAHTAGGDEDQAEAEDHEEGATRGGLGGVTKGHGTRRQTLHGDEGVTGGAEVHLDIRGGKAVVVPQAAGTVDLAVSLEGVVAAVQVVVEAQSHLVLEDHADTFKVTREAAGAAGIILATVLRALEDGISAKRAGAVDLHAVSGALHVVVAVVDASLNVALHFLDHVLGGGDGADDGLAGGVLGGGDGGEVVGKDLHLGQSAVDPLGDTGSEDVAGVAVHIPGRVDGGDV